MKEIVNRRPSSGRRTQGTLIVKEDRIIDWQCQTAEGRGILAELARNGAQRLLQAALEATVEDYISRHDMVRKE